MYHVFYSFFAFSFFFFFNDTATTEIYTLSLHDALPIPLPAPGRRTLGRRSAPTRCAPCLLQPLDERVEAGREPFIAVVEPDVLAERRQGGEAVGGQGAEELVEPFPRRRVAEALLVERGRRAADREADGVVDQQEEGETRLVGGEPGI